MPRPWPMTVGDLTLREAAAEDLGPLLALRNDPEVNRFMIGTSVDPEDFRREWLAVPTSETDHSCVAEVGGVLTAAFDHLGLRRATAGCNADNPASVRVLEKNGMRREQHGIEDSWHADLGWVDGYRYAILAREWHTPRTGRPAAG
ncbi:MAG: GNAT family N-acetyltransferase [Ornithinibacter sp.]